MEEFEEVYQFEFKVNLQYRIELDVKGSFSGILDNCYFVFLICEVEILKYVEVDV